MSKQKKFIVETSHKMRMAEHRSALMANGQWGTHKEKSHGSKKDYNRKAEKRKTHKEGLF